jgi:hypothetical protein
MRSGYYANRLRDPKTISVSSSGSLCCRTSVYSHHNRNDSLRRPFFTSRGRFPRFFRFGAYCGDIWLPGGLPSCRSERNPDSLDGPLWIAGGRTWSDFFPARFYPPALSISTTWSSWRAHCLDRAQPHHSYRLLNLVFEKRNGQTGGVLSSPGHGIALFPPFSPISFSARSMYGYWYVWGNSYGHGERERGSAAGCG